MSLKTNNKSNLYLFWKLILDQIIFQLFSSPTNCHIWYKIYKISSSSSWSPRYSICAPSWECRRTCRGRGCTSSQASHSPAVLPDCGWECEWEGECDCENLIMWECDCECTSSQASHSPAVSPNHICCWWWSKYCCCEEWFGCYVMLCFRLII